jgi:CBS domain-containing protein
MNAIDVMTAPVITVSPYTAVRDIVAILIDKRISGVPVVENGEVVGMVGEGDLVHRHEIGTDDGLPYRTWWQRLAGSDPAPDAYVKSHGGRARDIMSHELAPIAQDTPVARIASIFEARHIRRLPVLHGTRLVGIVTRTDLVRALAANTRDVGPSTVHTDESIRARLVAELEKQPWWQAKWCAVFVTDGIVRYRGVYERESDRRAARVAAENVAGVRAVEDDRVSSADWQPMV